MRPPSRESQTDSSTEDLNDLTSKGLKRLHELNGSHPHVIHSYTLSQPLPHYQPQRSHSPHQGYQPHKRRHQMAKFGSPPHARRNKHPTVGPVNYQQVPDRYLARSKLVEVRETPEQLITGSKWDQLSSAIWTKFINNQQTTNDYVNKMTLFKHLYSHIKVCLRYSVFVVGSTFNGFGTSSSDLDLCLVIRNQQLLDLRADAIHHLINTLQLFSRINYTGTEFQKLELIEAKVPLLKFHHSLGVDVDVNCNNSVGIRNTHLLHCYSMADWRVKPLVLVVKLWAQYHEINDAKNMTISSYSLALMVIHFLQYGTQPAVLPCLQLDFPQKFRHDQEIHDINMLETLELRASSNTQTLGELLLQFFHYYNNFNYGEDAISVRLGSTLPIERCRRFPSPKNEPRAWTYLCIEEPFDHTNTARSVYDQEKFEHIRKVFAVSYQRLHDTLSLDSIFHLRVA
ncbi:poly(A) RNA polymerase gld-2 homolog A-like isoform X2 [Homalodisca vitripennis]|nr:poly(A) RNA polymerase gld-2 homolog A-like isoform X2 [Homalodisca vitripennis]